MVFLFNIFYEVQRQRRVVGWVHQTGQGDCIIQGHPARCHSLFPAGAGVAKDVVVEAVTGSGKTLAYLVSRPARNKAPTTAVV